VNGIPVPATSWDLKLLSDIMSERIIRQVEPLQPEHRRAVARRAHPPLQKILPWRSGNACVPSCRRLASRPRLETEKNWG